MVVLVKVPACTSTSAVRVVVGFDSQGTTVEALGQKSQGRIQGHWEPDPRAKMGTSNPPPPTVLRQNFPFRKLIFLKLKLGLETPSDPEPWIRLLVLHPATLQHPDPWIYPPHPTQPLDPPARSLAPLQICTQPPSSHIFHPSSPEENEKHFPQTPSGNFGANFLRGCHGCSCAQVSRGKNTM